MGQREEESNVSELLAQAKNRSKKSEKTVQVTITVAEFLHLSLYPLNYCIVRDTEGDIWVIHETLGDAGPYEGLVSRYDLSPGTELILHVTETITRDTKCYVLKKVPGTAKEQA